MGEQAPHEEPTSQVGTVDQPTTPLPTPHHRPWSPYKPLFTQRKLHQHLAPKVTGQDALKVDKDLEAEEEAEADTSAIIDVLPPGPSGMTLLQW